MIFDINDFDETHPGPFEWDVKRLAASVVIAGRNNGFKKKQTAKHARAVARYYRNYLLASVELSTLDCWYARIDVDNRLPELRKRLDSSTAESTQKMLKKARHRDSMQAVSKLCWVDDAGRAHIRSDPPLLVPLTELATDRMFPAAACGRRAKSPPMAGRSWVCTGRACPNTSVRSTTSSTSSMWHARSSAGSVGLQAWVILMCGARARTIR